MINQERVETLVQRFPLLLPTAQKLNSASIDWMIAGSSCLFVLGNERLPDDADISLHDEQHDAADKLFGIKSYIHNSPAGPTRNSNPEGDHSIQLTSRLEFNFDKKYVFSVTETVNANKIHFNYQGTDMYLLPPEDVLLIKALLQRGPDEGKQDIIDIQNFMKIYKIDRGYMSRRIAELGAESRVNNILL